MCDDFTSFLHLAENRRSVRKYRSESIHSASVERCLEAARLAPSANNGQPWEFIIVVDDVIKRKLAKAARFGPLHANPFVSEVPVIVIVNETPGHRPTRWGGRLLGRNFPLMDIGMSVMQFCLQAAQEGLGTCIIGLFSAREVRRAVDFPRSHRTRLLLALGKPEDGAPFEKKRKAKDQMSRYIGRKEV
ncbi:MAG: nitroreductase family protein [Spirochaetaceae bacterium]|nr:nitroreductase family protein [Spirochaetaceae bacterium]MDT8297104.1 nitroreductase family protein [Spirochaetaceae bacterium]